MNIERYEDRYIINEDGTIISLYTHKPIKQYIGRGGYPSVVLKGNDGKQHHEYIHKLLAEKFIPNPNNLPTINHKDENRLNYSLNNLEWVTYQYNNTYNNRHLKASEKLKGKSPWNKGQTNILSIQTKQKISRSMKGHPFWGNQYTK